MKSLLLNFLSDIKRNYKTLILAFILAAALWIVVSVSVFPMITREISGIAVEAELTDYMRRNNLQIVSSIDETVDVVIEGKRYDISGLKASDFTASVDLSTVNEARTYEKLPIRVTSKSGAEIDNITVEPPQITVTVDEIITKDFEVVGKAPYITLPDEFYVDEREITTSVGTISISGSASLINRISRVEAQSSYHGDITESLETNSEIILFGENGAKIVSDNITLSADKIMVNIPVYRQKELPLNVVVKYPEGFDTNSLKYEINPKTITVAGLNNIIENLSKFDVGTIDISEIPLDKNSFFTVPLPQGYKNLSGTNSVTVVWKTDGYASRNFTINKNNITVTNEPGNFSVSKVTEMLNITVMGPEQLVEKLTENDFTATINLLGVSIREGTQDVDVSIALKGSEQKCWVSGKYKATILSSAANN